MTMDGPPHSHQTDVHSPERRSFNMSRIRGRDTKPEMLIRRGLHVRGYRFRLHDARLPGTPDLVLPKWRAIILVHGCFWHGHDCPLFHLPATRLEFWREKINSNRTRDRVTADALADAGWRLLTVWECALRGRAKMPVTETLDACDRFLRGTDAASEVRVCWGQEVG